MKPFVLALLLLLVAPVADAACPTCQGGNCELKTIVVARPTWFGFGRGVVLRPRIIVVPKAAKGGPKAE